MPAEINEDVHWVLHCVSRADCPIATTSHVSTINATSPRADHDDRSPSPRLPRNDVVSETCPRTKRRGVSRDRRRRRAESHASKTEQPSDRRDESSLARVPRIGGGEEVETIPDDLRVKSRALTEPLSGRRRRGRRDGRRRACLVAPAVSSRGDIENVPKDERLSVTRWCPRVDANDKVDEVERAESRLRDGTERSRLAIAEPANGASSIPGRRSLQDRSWTRLRPSCRGRKNLDAYYHHHHQSDRTGDTRTAGESPPLSSHRSHARSKEEEIREDAPSKDVIGVRFHDEDLDGDDTWTTDGNGRRDAHPERDPADRKRNGRGRPRVRTFLLTLLFFVIACGRCAPFGTSSSGVLRYSARSTASGLCVLGFGAIVGAVSAKPIDLLTGDAATRAERSANLSHITGASRKIQMYIKNRHLQILPDGTVNGSNDDTSDYTIFQRTSVSRGQLRIQGVATCLYLCMDSCGLLYGSREFTEDCVFNETLEQHNYNTYSSVRWSTAKKTLYLGLNRHGQPRRVQAKGHNLGRLSAYARVLTQVAPLDRVEALQRRMSGSQHNVRHQRHGHNRRRQHGGDVAQQQSSVCPTLPTQEKDGRDRFRCRRRKKRKKRKRRCRPGERAGPQCRQVAERWSTVAPVVPDTTEVDAEIITHATSITTTPESKRSCEGAASEEACRRQAFSAPAKKRKSRIDDDDDDDDDEDDDGDNGDDDDDDDDGGRNLTLNGKNKAPTSNAKKPSVSVADSQSKSLI